MFRDSIEVFIFYFDVIGTVSMFQNDWADTLNRLENFQHLVRERVQLNVPGSNLTTIADNVVARVHIYESDVVPELVCLSINAARESGFSRFFGAVTFGFYEPDLRDQSLWTGGDATDVRKQHIGFSEPYLRAAVAEKWSAHFAVQGLPKPAESIWLSDEVLDHIEVNAFGPLQSYGKRDMKNLPLNGKPWPFTKSVFTILAS